MTESDIAVHLYVMIQQLQCHALPGIHMDERSEHVRTGLGLGHQLQGHQS
jgi:hypothetical protein